MVEYQTDRPDQRKIDLLLQYALVRAAQEDDWRDRELGPIHLLKYAYLADCSYAERHDGQTFTGVAWRFYHFGPWHTLVHDRIEPALQEVHAERKTIRGASRDADFLRFSIVHDADRLRDRLENELPAGVAHAVGHVVHEFGGNTAALLRHVYLTAPMLGAAPGEPLIFAASTSDNRANPESEVGHLTAKQRRETKAVLSALREKIRGHFAQRVVVRRTEVSPPPRYDELFVAGTEWLDVLAGEPVEHLEGELTVSPEIWKSPTRTDPDVP